MANKILVNANSSEEIRIAVVSNGELADFDLQSKEHFRTKSNIYKGVVTRIEPSLEAVFVNYGEERNGFLPAKEIVPEYLSEPYNRRKDLKSLVKVGQEMIVQVAKEARKDKGAALTTFITIASRFIVLNRGSQSEINISRHFSSDERNDANRIINEIGVPEGFGAIVRTAAAGRSEEELKWDMDYLKRLWDEVSKIDKESPAPILIIKESDVITRTLRDQLLDEVEEIIVDSPKEFETVKGVISQTAPNLASKIVLYESDVPLFTHYDIEKTVRSAFQHIVQLPSGGQLVMDRTEAMFIIDVNSSRANKGANVEDTALTNNLEAVKEIALQMKIRDIGGLIVIDFIDMMERNNKAKVEDMFKTEVRKDKSRVRMGSISRFGMMELSRQRLRSSLDEFYLQKCPLCNGSGTILTASALASQIFRRINELCHNSIIKSIFCEMPGEVYDILIRTQGEQINQLKEKYQDEISLSSNPDMEIPLFKMSYKNVNGVEIVVDGKDDTSDSNNNNNNNNDVPSNVKREPMISAVDIMSETSPNKESFWGKLSAIIKKLFRSRKPRYKGQGRRRHGKYRRGGGRRGGSYSSQSRQGNRGNSSYRGGEQNRNSRGGRGRSRSGSGSSSDYSRRRPRPNNRSN